MADAYKLKADTSFPRVLRETSDGQEEVEGRAYNAGDYVLAADLNARDRDRAENGELDHLLEESSVEDAEAAQLVNEFGVFIPEHEAQRVILEEAGHKIVPRDQVLELKSAGADEAREQFEGAIEDDASERPALTAPEVPSLAEVSAEGVLPVPSDSDPVAVEALVGVEQPAGGQFVGEDKVAQEAPKKRGRPRKVVAEPKAEKVAKQAQEKENK